MTTFLKTCGFVLIVHLICSTTMAQGLAIGASAPNFNLEDQDAYRVHFTDFRGSMVVLEWINPNCPAVKRHYEAQTMKNIALKYKGKGFVYIAINSTPTGTKEINKEWLTSHQLPYSILDDHEGNVAKLYGVDRTPMMFIFDSNHKLVYKGAVDDDPKGEKQNGRINYIERAIDELKAGKAITTPEIPAYGCHIKSLE